MTTDDRTERAHWISVLARASTACLERLWSLQGEPPAYEILRAPETGLVMVRGRAGGSGASFNLGETTVTRCAVKLADGTVGHAYVMGTGARHAEIAAIADALMQRPADRARLAVSLIEPLQAEMRARASQSARRSAATRVEFFTMVRGDD